MTSKYRLNVIGPSSRKHLKKTSPFATLILDVSASLTEEDVSQLKLALQLDKLMSRWKLSKMKHAADVLSTLEQDGYLSKTDTHFLEQLLVKIGRKDLEQLIFKYNKRQEQQSELQHAPDRDHTSPKVIDSHDNSPASFTQLRRPPSQHHHNTVIRPSTPSHTTGATRPRRHLSIGSDTHVKDLHLSGSSGFIPSKINAQSVRPGPDGTSMTSSPLFACATRRPLQDVQNSAADLVAQSSHAKSGIVAELQNTASTPNPGMSLNGSLGMSAFAKNWCNSITVMPTNRPKLTMGMLDNGCPINSAFSTTGSSTNNALPMGDNTAQHRATNNDSPAGSPPNSSQSSQMSVDMASQKSSSQMSVSDDEKLAVYMEKVWPHESDDANMTWIGAD